MSDASIWHETVCETSWGQSGPYRHSAKIFRRLKVPQTADHHPECLGFRYEFRTFMQTWANDVPSLFEAMRACERLHEDQLIEEERCGIRKRTGL